MDISADALADRRASDNHTGHPPGSGSGARSCTTRTTTASSLIRAQSRYATRARTGSSQPGADWPCSSSGRAAYRCQLSHHGGVTGVSHGDELSRYALSVSESPVTSGDEIADHQVIIRGGQVEAVGVPLEEYRALKALEQREAELYWAVHEARYPSRPGDDAPDGKVYDSMDALLADLGSDG